MGAQEDKKKKKLKAVGGEVENLPLTTQPIYGEIGTWQTEQKPEKIRTARDNRELGLRVSEPVGQTAGSAPKYDGAGTEVLLRAADRVLNAEKFSYDPDTDPAYEQYEKTYTRLGQRAMEDTVGQVSARTGGLASSYAATAAQQAYDGYMAQLADKVPQLRQLAYDMYRDERQDRLDELELLRDMESERYDRWRDEVADWQDDREFDRDVYEDERDFGRDVYEDERDFGRDVYEDERDFDRDVYEDERDFEQDVLESEREHALAQQKAAQSAGSTKNNKGDPTDPDWSVVEDWVKKHGADSAEDYIRENYKKLGYSTVSAALAGWNNHNRQQDYERKQQQRLANARRGVALNGDGQPVDEYVRGLFDELVGQGLSREELTALVEDWAAKGWYGLDGEGALGLLALLDV